MLLKIPLINRNSEDIKQISPIEGNKSFCMALWIHTHLSTVGIRKFCSVSHLDSDSINNMTNDSNIEFLTLEKYWNSEKIKNIRLKMMKGETISECFFCNNNYFYKNYRDAFNNKYKSKINEVFIKTKEDGYTEMLPISYSYNINNTCNFKCRICNPNLSSAIENESKKINFHIRAIKNHNYDQKIAEDEMREIVNNKTIEEIFWIGGESLMLPFHWEIMSELINNGHCKNVFAIYTTNLSKISYKNHNLLDMLLNFKNIKIHCSIDGTEEIVEYIRDGMVWKKWLENFKSILPLKNKFGDDCIIIDYTVTMPGILAIKKIIDFIIEYDVNIFLKKVFTDDNMIILSFLSAPKKIMLQIIDDLIDYAKTKIHLNSKINNFIVFFEEIKNEKFIEETHDNYKEIISLSKNKILFLDNYRKHNGVLDKILSNHKDLYDWWQSI